MNKAKNEGMTANPFQTGISTGTDEQAEKKRRLLIHVSTQGNKRGLCREKILKKEKSCLRCMTQKINWAIYFYTPPKIEKPPSTQIMAPVTNWEASLSSQTNVPFNSSG